MAQLTIRINGYAYTVGCEDGQEQHLQAMAQQIDNRITGLKSLGGQSGESRLLMLAALVMADELHDLNAEMAALRSARPSRGAANGDAALGKRLSNAARRAEQIAATLEQP